jgi:small-conductance mechanosensitive channel
VAVDSIPELLRAIESAIPEGVGQITASVAILAVVLSVRSLAGRWRRTGGSGVENAARRLVVSAVVAAVTGIGVLLLVGVWGLLDPLILAFQDLGLSALGGEVVLSVVLIGGAYTMSSFLGRVIEAVTASSEHVTSHQREVVYRLTQVTIYSVIGLLILTLLTDNVGSLLVGAGFLGIVVGMAARQTLGSVLAGFVLMFARPFEIGDWIEVDEYEGTVTDITVVDTRIRTFDGEYVVVPNDVVGSSSLVNRSRKGRLRVEVEVGVDYDADPAGAAEVALDAVEGLEEILAVPTPQVVLKRFGDSAVVLGVRVWIDDPSARRRWRARSAVVEAVKGAFAAEGIKIPFPQRELAGREEAGGVLVAGGDGAADGADPLARERDG